IVPALGIAAWGIFHDGAILRQVVEAVAYREHDIQEPISVPAQFGDEAAGRYDGFPPQQSAAGIELDALPPHVTGELLRRDVARRVAERQRDPEQRSVRPLDHRS